MRVFITAVEPSADAIAADLVRALRARQGRVGLSGVGGPELAREGLRSLFDPRELAVVGLTEALQVMPLALRRAGETARAAIDARPQAAVLVDAWGFTTQIARRLPASVAPFPLVKYIGPQVWAARPGRARKVAALYDRLVALFPFETPFYRDLGLPVHVCGLPALQEPQQGDGAALRRELGLSGPLLLLAPGSRAGEIARVAPVLEAAAAQLCAQRPNLTVLALVAPSVREAVEARAQHWPFPHRLLLDPARKADAFAAADAALAASGTVTSEIAVQGCPVVVGYKVGWATAQLMRPLIRTPYATLMNVAAGAPVAPEFIQERFRAESVAQAAARVLDDSAAAQAQASAQREALRILGGGERPAAETAADAVEAAAAAPLLRRR